MEGKNMISILKGFVWKEGDLQYVGHRPLTEEQKELVRGLRCRKSLKKRQSIITTSDIADFTMKLHKKP